MEKYSAMAGPVTIPNSLGLKVTGDPFDFHEIVEDSVRGRTDFATNLLPLRRTHELKGRQQLSVEDVPLN